MPVVGQDITCPAAIARGGVIRIRSERAAQVARWFGLDCRGVRRDGDVNAVGDARANATGNHFLSPGTPALSLRPGTITLIAGPSGAGKSTLLRAARAAQPGRRWIDLADFPDPSTPTPTPTSTAIAASPLVDCFPGLSLRDALALLARVGLAEAWTYLRTPAELSEGQRWRFRLALALHEASRSRSDADDVDDARAAREFAASSAAVDDDDDDNDVAATPAAEDDDDNGAAAADEERDNDVAAAAADDDDAARDNGVAAAATAVTQDVIAADGRLAVAGPVIVCDEFAAVLDRVTAMVVAHRLRRAIGGLLPHAAALVATSHDDIEPALAADVIVRCDFGRAEVVNRLEREGREARQGREEREERRDHREHRERRERGERRECEKRQAGQRRHGRQGRQRKEKT